VSPLIYLLATPYVRCNCIPILSTNALYVQLHSLMSRIQIIDTNNCLDSSRLDNLLSDVHGGNLVKIRNVQHCMYVLLTILIRNTKLYNNALSLKSPTLSYREVSKIKCQLIFTPCFRSTLILFTIKCFRGKL
jgi:hypothetical protein